MLHQCIVVTLFIFCIFVVWMDFFHNFIAFDVACTKHYFGVYLKHFHFVLCVRIMRFQYPKNWMLHVKAYTIFEHCSVFQKKICLQGQSARWFFSRKFRCTTANTVQSHFITHGTHWKENYAYQDCVLSHGFIWVLPVVFWWEKVFFFVQVFFWFVQKKRLFVQPLYFLRNCIWNIQ